MFDCRTFYVWGLALCASLAATSCYDGVTCQSNDDCFAGEYCSNGSCVSGDVADSSEPPDTSKPVDTADATDSSDPTDPSDATDSSEPPDTSVPGDALDGSDGSDTPDAPRRAGAPCRSHTQCRSNLCEQDVCSHRAFVTAERFDGALGGLRGAHLKCREAARNARLEGTWKAILSDSDRGARDRIDLKGAVANLEGQLIASKDGIWSNDLKLPPDRTETGTYIGCEGCLREDSVWTGSKSSGTPRNQFCNDWTSSSNEFLGDIGDAGDTGEAWLAEDFGESPGSSPTDCSKTARLYCIDGQR